MTREGLELVGGEGFGLAAHTLGCVFFLGNTHWALGCVGLVGNNSEWCILLEAVVVSVVFFSWK